MSYEVNQNDLRRLESSLNRVPEQMREAFLEYVGAIESGYKKNIASTAVDSGDLLRLIGRVDAREFVSDYVTIESTVGYDGFLEFGTKNYKGEKQMLSAIEFIHSNDLLDWLMGEKLDEILG